jgi:hypothetical protein
MRLSVLVAMMLVLASAVAAADPAATSTLAASSPSRYDLVLDRHFTSSASAETLSTLHRVVYLAEDSFLPPVLWDEHGFGPVLGGVVYRLARSILLDNVLDHLVFLAQHEVFGHGGRYREIGYVDNSFHLSLFFPYGDAHGYARIGSATRATTDLEHVLRIIGGNEGTTVLARAMRTRWAALESIHYHEVFLYVASACNLPLYVIGTQVGLLGGSSNDITQYLSTVGVSEVDVDMSTLTLRRLALYSLLTFADPFLCYSMASYIRYLGVGRVASGVPMIPIGEVGYLSAFHLMLSPFGPEFVMESYLRGPRRLVSVTARFTDPAVCASMGMGVRISPARDFALGAIPFSVDVGADIWYQPVLPTPDDHPILLAANGADAGLGGLIRLRARVDLLPRSGLTAEIVAKSDGYVEGETLYGCVLIRAGLSFRL